MMLDSVGAWLSQPTVQQIGWVLVHFVWQGALVAGLLAGTLALMRREQAQLRYVMGLVALAALLVLPVATWMTLPAPAPSSGEAALSAQAMPAMVPSPVVSAVPTSAAPTSWTTVLQSTIADSLPWLVAGWLAGVLVLGARLLGGWMYAARLRRRHARPIEGLWQQRADELADRLGLRHAVRIWQSSQIDVPMVMGWLRPVVLVPAGVLTGLPPQQVDALIAHELSHIQRHDVLVGWIQVVVETLFFYHPAVWWISRQIRTEREHCCDDRAVAVCRDRLVYARALTTLATQRTAQPVGALAASDGSLLTRIRRLVKPSDAASTRDRMTAALALGAVLAVLVAVGACATQRSASTDATTEAQASASAEPSAVTARADAPDSADVGEREEEQTVVHVAPDGERTAALRRARADSNEVIVVWTEDGRKRWEAHLDSLGHLDSLSHEIPLYMERALAAVDRALAAHDTLPRPPLPMAPRVFPGDSLSAVFPDIDVPDIDFDVRDFEFRSLDSLRFPRAPIPPPAIYFDRDKLEKFDALQLRLADSLSALLPPLRALPDSLEQAQIDSIRQRVERQMQAYRDKMREFSEEHRERMERLHRELRERMLEEQPERLREQAEALRRQAERLEEQAREMEQQHTPETDTTGTSGVRGPVPFDAAPLAALRAGSRSVLGQAVNPSASAPDRAQVLEALAVRSGWQSQMDLQAVGGRVTQALSVVSRSAAPELGGLLQRTSDSPHLRRVIRQLHVGE